MFRKLDLQVEDAIKDLNQLDHLVENEEVLLPSDLSEVRIQVHNSVFVKLYLRESGLSQTSRYRWLKEGDLNSKFFHSFMKARFCRNGILELNSSSNLIEYV